MENDKRKAGKYGKLSIRMKIMIIMLLVAGVSLFTNMKLFLSMEHANQNSIMIAEDLTNSIVHFSVAYEYTLAMDGMGVKHFLAEDAETKAGLEGMLVSCYQTVVTSLDQLKISMNDEADREVINRMSDDINAYFEYMQQALELSNEGNGTAAYELMNAKMAPISGVFFEDLLAMNAKLQAQLTDAIDEIKHNRNDSFKEGIGMMIIYTVAVIIASIMTNRFIIRPMIRANKELKEITDSIHENRGDLSQRLTVTGDDEINGLIKGVNSFIMTLETTINKIHQVSSDFSNSFSVYDQKFGKVFEKVEDNSASVEEMSAGMEETDASMQQINHATESIGELVSTIANRSVTGAELANSISLRADQLKSNSTKAKSDAQTILEEIGQSLQNTIEKSKEVEKINMLTNTILEITSQTNLLALNASIEAARAGEMGKGFSVVAEEIGHLAENSRDTANQIQKVSTSVIGSVKELAENANQILNFVNQQVMKDYTTMVENGVQYDADAKSVDDLMKEFRQMANSLNQTIAEISGNITSVTSIVSESTTAANNIAANSEELLAHVESMREQLNDNKRVVAEFDDIMQRFQ